MFASDIDIKNSETTQNLRSSNCDSQIRALKYKNIGISWNSNKKKSENDLFNLETLLESERIDNDNETWSKLNKTIKLKKILVYANKYKEQNNLSDDEYDKLIYFLRDCLDKKKLQRVKDVEYNRETGEILSIPALFYNKNNNHFTLKNLNKKVSTLKSLPPKKSNVGQIYPEMTDEINNININNDDCENNV
jgi:hypothetical protein